MPCSLCHEGQDPPKIEAAFSMPRAEPGQPVTLTVTATHSSAAVGGVWVNSHGRGQFRVLDAATTRVIGLDSATHSQPSPYTNGQLRFSFEWVAPSEVGTTRFDIWANAANNNLMQLDDSPAQIATFIAHGCEGTWYYPDGDGDGFGDEKRAELACQAPAGLIPQGGDCDDMSPTVNPSIPETCNNIDDNCDGTVDEGYSPMRHYVDADGDGFGAIGGQTVIGCSPIPGYAPRSGDCDDRNATTFPGADELPNGVDDDCDGEIDETVGPPLGMMPAPSPSGGSGSVAPNGSAPRASSCGFSPLPLRAESWLVGLLLIAARRRRSRSSPAAR